MAGARALRVREWWVLWCMRTGGGGLLALGCAWIAIAGCDRERELVQWSAPRPAGAHEPDAMLRLDEEGPRMQPPTPLLAFSPEPMCARTLRVAHERASTVFAAWWRPRADSSATLLVARSDDGGVSWRPPVAVDTLDRGRRGCRRPAPAIVADSATGYVHIAYFLEAPEGAGVFFSHSMEGGELFHEPVAIMYGDRPSATAVAASRDLVAVAFEEPNAGRSQIWLALSGTAGHIFHARSRVSGTTVASVRPRVALRDSVVAVAWSSSDARGGDASVTPAEDVVIRRGRLPAAMLTYSVRP